MKKLTVIFAIVFSSCIEHQEIDPYHPKRPAGVPTHSKDGSIIEWNWDNQRAYNNGNLFFERDSTGEVIAVIRKIK